MKEKRSALKDVLYTLLFLPLILLSIIGFLAFTPIDFFRYKRMAYYKETHTKYHLFISLSPYVQLYNAVKKSALPIDYHPTDADFCEGYGFFTYKNTLLLNDLVPSFDEKENEWKVESGNAYVSLQDEVNRILAQCNAFLDEGCCEKAIVLVKAKLLAEHPENTFENFSFVPVEKKKLAEALQSIAE